VKNVRILVVEDSPSMAEMYKEYLQGDSYQVDVVSTGQDALIKLKESLPSAILLDVNLPDMSGMDILKVIHEQQLPVVSLVITGHGSVDLAVESMNLGAYDFIEKPFTAKRIKHTLSNALEHQALTEALDTLQDEYGRNGFEDFIGSSLPMQGVYRIIESAAPSNATVFVTGESGTGKEVCATSIHKRSQRSKQEFIALNCGAIPHDLMESEIFGHTKGAFTGAISAREGAASRADGGTLFLDELCEMELDLQTKLLRFIQTGTFQKVGSNVVETVDVRFICATNKDPLEEVKKGNFREDLYYRLHVIPIHLPPLRERGQDIALIMNKLLKEYAGEENKAFSNFSGEVEMIMQSYDWPGNVRQLQNVIRNVVVLNNGDSVNQDMLPPPLNELPISMPLHRATNPQPASVQAVSFGSSNDIKPLWQTEKEAIEAAISYCDDNVPKAAALLEVSASTIYRKRERWSESEI
jgi:two-component system repressor protein LuxO